MRVVSLLVNFVICVIVPACIAEEEIGFLDVNLGNKPNNPQAAESKAVETPILNPKESAFDEIAEYNDALGLKHNHPPGFHVYEGDIMAADLDLDEPVDARKRGAVSSELRLWRARVVPYKITKERQNVTKEILAGLYEISNKTCVRFVEQTVEENYISFILDNGCWSYIGSRGGEQNISIGIGCHRREIVAHEMLHALGFYHEQSRLDRDDFVKIYWDNIEKKNSYNFRKAPPNAYTDSNLPYDLRSVMHYGNYAFTKNGKETIIAKKYPKLHLGNDRGLSLGDADELNRLYKCYDLPLGGYGPWYDESSCIDGLRIRFRICYGDSKRICGGYGFENGVQRVREACEGKEPLAAYMEGCYNQLHPEVAELPVQQQATKFSCASLSSPSKNFYDWRRKEKIAFVACAHFARRDGYLIFGISNYCHCHYGNDLADIQSNGKSKWCSKGYGVKEALYLYRFEVQPKKGLKKGSKKHDITKLKNTLRKRKRNHRKKHYKKSSKHLSNHNQVIKKKHNLYTNKKNKHFYTTKF